MNIFVVNSGSSSIKYQLFRMPDPQPVCTGLVERIGQENALIKHKLLTSGQEKAIEQTGPLRDHEAGLQKVVSLLTQEDGGVLRNPDEIHVVGHRVVHGGESFAATTIIDEAVKQQIRELFSLAPLHNPANYTGIEVAEKIFTRAKQVAVFDTAFHQTMPPHAYRYAIPKRLYDTHKIRAYGFHGTSHKWVTSQAMKWLGNPAARLISIHLGNGCSMAAVDGGRSIDTSMGFGPLSGLVMGTRSGDIDPSILFFLMEKAGYSPEQVADLLNKQSGMLGMTGFSDMRDVGKLLQAADQEALLAWEIYAYRIKKYIGAYTAALNGLDAIIFTAGVGENDRRMREEICSNLEVLSIALDPEKNQAYGDGLVEISKDDARVKILVVPTNEELEIARQCYELLSGS
ncbi:MAG: acetate kinase [Williamsia sp.]|nr:acetate kinase [Williamsia sp.]